MFNRLKSNNIFIKNISSFFLVLIIFFLIKPVSSIYAYEGIRVTANDGKKCADSTEESNDCFIDGVCDKDISAENRNKCYSSQYDQKKESCDVGSMYFNPFGRDVNWEPSNAHCISFIVTTGVALATAFNVCDSICPSPPTPIQNLNAMIKASFTPSVEASRISQIASKAKSLAQSSGNFAGSSASASFAMTSAVIDPIMIGKIGLYSARCANILSIADSSACCTAAASCAAAYTSAIAILGTIFEVSKSTFQETRICGDGTKIWLNNENTWSKDDHDYFKCLKYYFSNSTEQSIITFPNDDVLKNRPTKRLFELKEQKQMGTTCDQKSSEEDKNFSNQFYREHLFKGIEYIDNGSDACDNPVGDEWNKSLGYSGGKQRYYFRGAPEQPNFVCSRFLAQGMNNIEGFKAYKCCKKRARDTICLERPDTNKYKFCSATGGICSFEATKIDTLVTFEVYESFSDPRYLCAKTYSLCPYNHPVAGGTEEVDKDYFTLTNSNFCQIRRHCIKKPPTSDVPLTSISDNFFSEACMNRKGDSQFIQELENIKSPIPIKSRNFSAPIVQCLKESLENNFFQIAGRDICANKNDVIINGKCKSLVDNSESEIFIKKGQKIDDSIFSKIQKKFKIFIKLAMIIAVVMLGYKILVASPEIFLNKKTLLLFLLKLGLIAFFALSTSWHSMFLNQLLKISDELSTMTFFPVDNGDGCNFPKFNGDNLENLRKNGNDYKLENFVNDEQKNLNNKILPSYPVNKSYLRIWDTLDCKLSRAIGYGPDVNSENFTKMIFSGFLVGPLGITFAFAAMAYGFMLISIILRAIHIVIMSLMGVILLIFISPLTITCALFDRTKGIFENWYKQLMGFILQPMILFAYLGVLLTIFDNVFLGDAKFETFPKTNTTNATYLINQTPKINCEDKDNIKPNETSIYCIFQFQKFQKYTGLEVFNLAIPILRDLNKEKINTIIRAAIILFVFYQFLDKITFLAKKLVGGPELKADAMPNIQNKLKKFARGVQKRALNATTRFANKGAKKIARSVIGTGSSRSSIPKQLSFATDSAESLDNVDNATDSAESLDNVDNATDSAESSNNVDNATDSAESSNNVNDSTGSQQNQ